MEFQNVPTAVSSIKHVVWTLTGIDWPQGVSDLLLDHCPSFIPGKLHDATGFL